MIPCTCTNTQRAQGTLTRITHRETEVLNDGRGLLLLVLCHRLQHGNLSRTLTPEFCFVSFCDRTKTPWPCVSRALPLSCLHRLCFSETSWAAMSHLKVVGLNSQEKTSHPPASSACSLFWVQAQQREVRLATSLPCT